MLVAKLEGARERKKAVTGKCGGRKSYAERRPELVAIAKRLARYLINGRKRSLRDIAAELEAQGHGRWHEIRRNGRGANDRRARLKNANVWRM